MPFATPNAFRSLQGATTTHAMAAILVLARPLSLYAKLLLLLLFIMTTAVSSARPHPPSLAIEEALKAAMSSAAAAKEPKAIHVLARRSVPRSGPSNKGHSAPTSKRHLLHLHAGNDRVGRE
ncbi:unnamed protein product [Musa acuminata var. zebrina]